LRWSCLKQLVCERASVLHRYVAMAVPKVACSTFKVALQIYEGCAPEGDLPARTAAEPYRRFEVFQRQ